MVCGLKKSEPTNCWTSWILRHRLRAYPHLLFSVLSRRSSLSKALCQSDLFFFFNAFLVKTQSLWLNWSKQQFGVSVDWVCSNAVVKSGFLWGKSWGKTISCQTWTWKVQTCMEVRATVSMDEPLLWPKPFWTRWKGIWWSVIRPQ